VCCSRRLSLFALALVACHGKADEGPAPLPSVKALTVTVRAVAPHIPIAGVLTPLPGKDVKVGALVAGRVDRVFVAEGDPVKLGAPLAHVEAEPLRQHLSEADAQKTTAHAALDNARTRLVRTERLWKDGISAKQEVDDARAAMVAAESALKQAEAGGGIAQINLDRATLRAPIAGVVAAILVPAGQPVDGNGTPVIEIADTRVLNLRAPVAAGRIGAVSLGQRALVVVEGVGQVVGAVEAIAPLVDVATNTVVVRVRIENATGQLRGGMFARGALVGAAHPGLAVPRAALLPGDGGDASTVGVLDKNNKLELRAVTLGDDSDGEVEVRAGLSAGDRVVVSGGYSLPDGVEVDPGK
jgi:RND family efflux transporter MFP subunit